jgi:ubiquinone biosynthesis protein COQ9
LYYSTTFLYLLKEEIFVSSAEETSATLIPEADHEVVSLLEENGQEAALRNITNYQLESTEFERGYDIKQKLSQALTSHLTKYRPITTVQRRILTSIWRLILKSSMQT